MRRGASGTPSPLTTGTPDTGSCFIPQNLTSFKNSTKSWVGFSGGQHHTICMDSEGRPPKSFYIPETARVVLVLQDCVECPQERGALGVPLLKLSFLPHPTGKAYSLGRAEYGRLGLGEGAEEKSIPTHISRLPIVSSVACGASVGYAVSKDGKWGSSDLVWLEPGAHDDQQILVSCQVELRCSVDMTLLYH